MKCIHLCQELETSEDKAIKIPIFYEYENIEEVIQLYLIKLNCIQNSCLVTFVSVHQILSIKRVGQ